MITSNNKLQIFDNFIIDRNLPKYKKEQSDIDTSNFKIDGVTMVSMDPSMAEPGIIVGRETMQNSIEYCRYRLQNSLPYTPKWLMWKTLMLAYTYIPKISKPFKPSGHKTKEALTMAQLFDELKCKAMILDKDKALLEHYESVIKNALLNGQIALTEKLIAHRDIIIGEIALMSLGVKKYLEEEQVVKFYELATADKKNLKLTWIKNFARIIPSIVSEIKVTMDEARVFDNYVIMHYDPTGQAEQDTKEEVEKKKDPILFGVISGSRRLYFIADWVDEICDLTLKDVVEKIGEKALTINNKTVTKHINSITA